MALQLLGYAASILIATSLLMRSIVRLRAINLAGAAAFSVYGFLIGAYPVGVLNLMTATINVVQLVRLRRRREIFRAGVLLGCIRGTSWRWISITSSRSTGT